MPPTEVHFKGRAKLAIRSGMAPGIACAVFPLRMNQILYSVCQPSVLDGLAPPIARTIGGMPTPFHVEKLSDEFGQYTLEFKCSACGHERIADPHTLGRLCGWNAKLEDVAKRMRCSMCGKKKCTA